MEVLTNSVIKNLPPNIANDFTKIINTDYENSQNKHSTQNDSKINLNEIKDKKLKEIEKELNNIATSLNFDLNFQIHRDSGKIYVKIIDKNSHKVIKEIPPQSFLDFLSKFEKMLGVLFDRKG